nr:MAG TPA: hypothetical protein [Caudoviricetes sp.]
MLVLYEVHANLHCYTLIKLHCPLSPHKFT